VAEPPIATPDTPGKVSPESVLKAPRTPVTRWNRTYIILAAGLLASLVGAAFLIGFSPPPRQRPREEPKPNASDVTPSAPSFGERFAKGYADPQLRAGPPGTPNPDGSLPPGTAALPPPGQEPGQGPGPGQGQGSGPGPSSPTQMAPTAGTPSANAELQQARTEARAARSSSPFFANGTVGVEPRTSQPDPQLLLPVSQDLPGAQGGDVQPANGQGSKRQFLTTAHAQDYLPTSLRPPASPWEVKAGTVIPAALITAINSDLPGEVIAQVTRPVYDHATGRTVLIPQGSRLIGVYDSQIAYGQNRALIAWTRLIMPDGRSINIGSMGSTDLSGAAGLADQVNGHLGQLARGILLSSVFSIGAASAQDASSRSSGQFVVNSAASGAATASQQVGQQITQRDLGRQPTLQIRAGFPLTVLVNKDMVLAP